MELQTLFDFPKVRRLEIVKIEAYFISPYFKWIILLLTLLEESSTVSSKKFTEVIASSSNVEIVVAVTAQKLQ